MEINKVNRKISDKLDFTKPKWYDLDQEYSFRQKIQNKQTIFIRTKVILK